MDRCAALTRGRGAKLAAGNPAGDAHLVAARPPGGLGVPRHRRGQPSRHAPGRDQLGPGQRHRRVPGQPPHQGGVIEKGTLATTRKSRRGSGTSRRSASTTVTRGWPATRRRNLAAQRGSRSMAITRAPLDARAVVMAPCPAPRSRTRCPSPAPEARASRAISAASRRKWAPAGFGAAGRRPGTEDHDHRHGPTPRLGCDQLRR